MRVDGPTVIGAAILLALGAAIALLLQPARSVTVEKPSSDTHVPAPSASGPEAPALVGASDAGSAGRIAALEKAVADLREDNARLRVDVDGLKELREDLKKVGVIDPENGAVRNVRVGVGEGGPGDVADRLALEGGHRQQFLTGVKDFTKKLEEIEARVAKVTVDGNVTTIRIPAYSEDGKRLQADWDAWVERTLSPEERRRYRDQKAESLLFTNRLGDAERTITVEASADHLTVKEESKSPSGGESMSQSQGPLDARDVMLEPYRHLLPK